MIQRTAIIKGMVQGVGYRWFVTRAAMRFNITGYVMNLPDGNVKAEIEGEEAIVNDFINELRIGPPHAAVSGIEITEGEYTGEFQCFGVKYY